MFRQGARPAGAPRAPPRTDAPPSARWTASTGSGAAPARRPSASRARWSSTTAGQVSAGPRPRAWGGLGSPRGKAGLTTAPPLVLLLSGHCWSRDGGRCPVSKGAYVPISCYTCPPFELPHMPPSPSVAGSGVGPVLGPCGREVGGRCLQGCVPHLSERASGSISFPSTWSCRCPDHVVLSPLLSANLQE